MVSCAQENEKENKSNYLKSTFPPSEEEILSLRTVWEQQASLLTFKLGVDHDVQVIPWEGAQVPGDGVQTYGGVIQGEANSRVLQPRQATDRAGKKEETS